MSLSGRRILHIDVDNLEVTVEAGITGHYWQLGKVGLTLANFSSIKEQQMGGWTQVAAHGTGATLSTVDDMITRMKLITPAKGTIELSEPAAGAVSPSSCGAWKPGYRCGNDIEMYEEAQAA